jgi:hypothetical protein
VLVNGTYIPTWSYPVIYAQAPWGAWVRLTGYVANQFPPGQANLTLQAGYGAGSNSQTISTAFGIDEVIAINDPILFTVPVEECAEITREIWDDATERPIPVSDCADPTALTRDKTVGHPLYKLRLFERMVVGGQMTTSVTANGTTVTYSSTVTAANEVDYSVYMTQDLTAVARTASTSITWTIEGGGSTIPMYLPDYSYSDSYCTASASSGAMTVNLLQTTTVHLQVHVGYYRSYSITGALKAYDITYPGSVAMLIDEDNQHLGKRSLVADGWSNSGKQIFHGTIVGNRDGVQMPTVGIEDTRCALFAALSQGPVDGDTYTLSALGEDVDDLYVTFRCWPKFSAISASNRWLTFDNCSSLTPGSYLAGQWTGIGGAALSIENAQIRIDTAASGTQGARRTFTNRWANLSQGILEISMTGPSGPGITVTLYSPTGATKTWTRDRAGRTLDLANGTIYLDTCNPDSATAATDTWDTRWPLPTVDSDYSGVTSCNQLEIAGLQTSQTYHLVNLEVTWWARTNVTCMASRANWILEQTAQISEGVTSQTYIVRGILGASDGRQAFEDGHARLIVVTSSAGVDYEMYEVPISTLLSTTGNAQLEPWPPYPGWTMSGSIVSDPPDGTGLLSAWLNTNRYLGWLRGGGWAYVPGTGWVSGTDINADYHNSAFADLYGQVCVDRIDWYPGCGDAFSFSATNVGAYGDTIYLAAAAILRGGGHGLVYDSSTRLPANAVTVTDTDVPLQTDAGPGTTNSMGWWESGTPFGHGEHSIKTAVSGQIATTTWHNRKRQRVVLSKASPSSYRCVEYDYPRNWLHTSDSKKIKSVHAYDFAALMKSNDFAYTWMRLRTNPHDGSLLMLGITPATQPPYLYHVCFSTDGGLTMKELFSMTANSAQIEHDLARGLWVLLYEAGGAVQRCTCSDASDMSSWTSPVSLALSATLLDCAYDRRYGRMALAVTAGTVTKVLSSDDSGETWTERLV